VKPHQAGEAYVNFAMTNALKIIWRLLVGSPWLRSTLSACIDCTQRHVTSRTCSLTDRWFVTVIPSIFIDVTRWMSVSGGGGQTVHRRRLSVKIISKDFLRFIFSDFEGHYCCLKPFYVIYVMKYSMYYLRFVYAWIRKRIRPVISTIFSETKVLFPVTLSDP